MSRKTLQVKVDSASILLKGSRAGQNGRGNLREAEASDSFSGTPDLAPTELYLFPAQSSTRGLTVVLRSIGRGLGAHDLKPTSTSALVFFALPLLFARSSAAHLCAPLPVSRIAPALPAGVFFLLWSSCFPLHSSFCGLAACSSLSCS